MKSIALSAALLMCGVLASGCAAEGDVRGDADYPVGYTPPSEVPPPAPVPAQAQGQAQAQGPAQAQAQGQGDIEIGGSGSADEYSDTDPSAVTDFRSTLEPYGTWEDDPTYGTVWVPSESVVGDDFAPYVSAGHWDYDDDYVWVSDYDWGWAPFHYGRWVYMGGTGWGWVPGRTYAGAWVSWRCGYDDWAYVGWAPLPPTWYWYHGYAYGVAVVPVAPYAFVGTGDLFSPVVAGRVVTGSQVGVVGAHTRVYTPANPTVGGNGGLTGDAQAHVGAHALVSGPSPASLHIPANAVVHSTPSMPGATQLARAQQFARPSTAMAMGAHGPNGMAPTGALAHNGALTGGGNTAANGGALRSGSGYTGHPYTGGSSPSYPSYRSPSAGSTRPYYGSGGTTTHPYYGGATHPYYGGGHPAYSPPSHYSGVPSYHPSGGGGVPSYHPSAPSYHPTYSGGGGGGSYHMSGGGGGFHGGGGGRGGGHR